MRATARTVIHLGLFSGFWIILGIAFEVAAQQPAAPLPETRYQGPSSLPEQPRALETLEDAWNLALNADLRVEASLWNASSAARSLAAAQAERMPSVTLGADYIALSEEPSFRLPASGGLLPSQLPFFEQDSGGAGAVLMQPIYTSGRITSGIRAAQAGNSASHAELRRTRLDVKMSVAESYVAVLRTTRLVEVAENKAASLAAHARDVQAMVDRGVRAKTDLLSAQVALADARQQLFQAKNALDVARASYNRQLGRPLTEPVSLAELQEETVVEDIDQLTHQALQSRPEIDQLSAQAVALREQAAATDAKNGPQVAVAGGYLYQQNKYMTPNGVAGVGLTVQWNVFDSGRVCNQAAALRERAESLIRTRMDLESMVALEVRQKWLDLQTAVQRTDVARQANAQADENLRVVLDRYRQQVGTNTEVLDAETLRVQAYTNFYNSSYETALARLRLARAVGSL